MSRDSTTACVRAACTGDREAAGGMIERFTPWLLAQARLRLHGRLATLASPEDLVQDTWLVALRRLGDLRARDGRLTPVLVRFLATTLRRRLCELLERELRANPAPTALPTSSEHAATVTGACSAAATQERAELLWRTIHGLPERDQQLVVLRGLEGLPFPVIGSLLGIAADAAMSAWARTRTRLRDELDPVLRDDLEP